MDNCSLRFINTIFVPFSFLNFSVYWYLEHKYEGAILWLANVTSLNTHVSLSWNSNWRTLHELCDCICACVCVCVCLCTWIYLGMCAICSEWTFENRTQLNVERLGLLKYFTWICFIWGHSWLAKEILILKVSNLLHDKMWK